MEVVFIHIVSTLDVLNLPSKHKNFITQYLKNIGSFSCIYKVILFGSCAKGTASENSDVDIFVITLDDIPEELEYEIIFDNVPVLDEGYVKNDILLKSRHIYDKYKNTSGMLQKAVESEGVDISGILSASN